MSDSSLKSKITKGLLWSAIDKFGIKICQFAIAVVLARLLTPEDYGLIGLLSVFILISQVFINSGMGSGLIQRQNRTDADFSTVFIYNFIVSCFFYFLLFIAAPYIADFYNQPKLTILMRVLGLNLIIGSLAIVQRSKLEIAVNFKALAIINLIGVVAGGAIGVAAAIQGYGVWALVIQTIFTSIVVVVALWMHTSWKPSLLFSKESFRVLFGYGSKLLMAGVYAQVLQNIYHILIGKTYSLSDLGFYTKGKEFADVSSGTITATLQQVTFPILASLQHDTEKMLSVYRKMIRLSSFVVFPAMTLLAMLAEPIVIVLLGDKWILVIPLLQLMVFARIFYPISAINMNLLNAIGRSDLFLKVDLCKFPLILLALIITIPISVKAIVIGQIAVGILSFFINAYLPGRIYGYGAFKQLKDMFPVFLCSATMAVAVYLVSIGLSGQSQYIKLLAGGGIAVSIYVATTYLLKIKELFEIKSLVQKGARKYFPNAVRSS